MNSIQITDNKVIIIKNGVKHSLTLEAQPPIFDEWTMVAINDDSEEYEEVFEFSLGYSHRLNVKALQDEIEKYVEAI